MRINRVAAFAVAAAIAATISSAPAYAGTQTANFTVSADVAANCTISATNLDFTAYDPTSATDKDATSTVSVLCTNSSAWNIGLSAGGFSSQLRDRRSVNRGRPHRRNHHRAGRGGRCRVAERQRRVPLQPDLEDSFAVVDTGVSGIHVRQENRDVGRTDANGRMVVPDLLSFQVNQIAIDPLDAPVDADIALAGRGVRPLDPRGWSSSCR